MEIQYFERLQEGRSLNEEEQAQKVLLVADLERNNNIEVLRIEGVENREEEVIQDHVVVFFKKLLTEEVGWRPTLDGLAFDTIEPGDVTRLERAFEEEEIGSPSRGITTVSHLLFADDTLIMCEADHAQLRAVKALLLCFEAVSGLKVNYDKSELVPIGEVQDIRDLTGILGCKIASLPMTYLGLPLGIAPKSRMIWDT
ncbi:hypothetical protein F2P56_000468, partial [Juglans regia]